MANVFTTVLNMSLTACIVIAIVMLARLALRKAPKIFSYALWSVVLFRLLCPVAISLPLSILFPLDGASTQSSAVTSRMEYVSIPSEEVSAVENADASSNNAAAPGESAILDNGAPANEHDPSVFQTGHKAERSVGEIALNVLGWIWLAGVVGVFGVTLWQTHSVKRMLSDACIIRGNIYESDRIDTAFVLGIFNPKIYLPLGLTFDIQKAVVAHEQTHQRRGDNIIKFVSYIALSLHWFNPLVWLSFKLMCDDMEKSCDEAVVRGLHKRGYSERSVKKAYSQMLFTFGYGRQNVFSPVSFAEHSVKKRILNVAEYSRLARNAAIVLCAVCVLVAGVCIINPTGQVADAGFSVTSDGDAVEQHAPDAKQLTIGNVTFWSDAERIDLGKLDTGLYEISDFEIFKQCRDLKELILPGLYTGYHYNDDLYTYDLPYWQAEKALNTLAECAPDLERLEVTGYSPLAYNEILPDTQEGIELSIVPLLEQFKRLTGLRGFAVCSNNALQTLSSLENLTELDFYFYSALENYNFDFLSSLPRLTHLSFSCYMASDVVDISGLRNCRSLKSLDMRLRRKSLDPLTDVIGFSAIEELDALEHLYISNARDLDLSNFASHSTLRYLDLYDFDSSVTANIAGIGRFRNLETLGLSPSDNQSPLDLSFVSGLENLRKFSTYEPVTDLSIFSDLRNLEELSISTGRSDSTIDFSPLNNLTNLKDLRLSYYSPIDLAPIESLPNLERLEITPWDNNYERLHYNAAIDIGFLTNAENIADITIIGSCTDLSALTDKEKLCSFFLAESLIVDISPLSTCSALDYVRIRDCEKLTDISALSGLQKLETISLYNVPISDISFVSTLSELKQLDLPDTNVTDLSPLFSLKEFAYLCCPDSAVGSPQLDELQEIFPDCEIYGLPLEDGEALG